MTVNKKSVGLPHKREAIVAGALTLFARDGYTRAGLDAIAAEAGVSNRTIYNHFTDKAELFQTVIQESTQRAADTMVDRMDRHLFEGADPETALVELGLAWLALLTSDLAPHFALVRQINAEIDHIPAPALRFWRDNGPGRTRRELGVRLSRIPGLTMEDPLRAAGHLMLLVSADNLLDRSELRNQESLKTMVTAGVRVFLRGYANAWPSSHA